MQKEEKKLRATKSKILDLLKLNLLGYQHCLHMNIIKFRHTGDLGIGEIKNLVKISLNQSCYGLCQQW
ncbi:hypothetical protein [Sinomicrobium oceani]|uniref:hypothetical protein n=1 Tax=Sinomicrobium oceani TaxID=1150368 RepID=UPI00227CD974|nr:hypothetical protein [Sinomicrobium oceani]